MLFRCRAFPSTKQGLGNTSYIVKIAAYKLGTAFGHKASLEGMAYLTDAEVLKCSFQLQEMESHQK